jgi:xanthine/uracil permease
LALGALLAFLVILVLEHFLVSSLSPLDHRVSEYANASGGALMVAGFALWALSLFATSHLVWQRWRPALLTSLLVLGGLGMVLVAVFPTETSAGELPPGSRLTTTGKLHDLGSGLTSLALIAAAVGSAFDSRHSPRFRRRVAVLIGVTVTTSLVLLLIGPEVGGLRQRVLLLSGCCWQFLLLQELRSPPRERD